MFPRITTIGKLPLATGKHVRKSCDLVSVRAAVNRFLCGGGQPDRRLQNSLEPSYPGGGEVKRCSHFGKQCGSASSDETWNFSREDVSTETPDPEKQRLKAPVS